VQDAGVGVGIAFADEDIEELADAAAKLEHDCEAAARGANPGEIIGGGERQTGSALMEALRNEKLRLWYQPVGAEALCRWETNEGGVVSADRFWEMAVEHGIERDVTMWALRRAVTETQQLVEKRDIQIHVNCSLTQVDDPTFPDAILEAVNGVTPGHVVLEIVENGAREISQRMAANLRLVRGMGVKTALDDFGSGWSGLARLSNLEWDYVKIDRSLCHRVSQKTRQQACARAAIQVAQECGALVVVEGIEHQDDADVLMSLGAQYGQGYLWSRPGPVRIIA
jgi:EAL domain-containing protein (putative c-di-GMP-specific phosphodiesterase class I)